MTRLAVCCCFLLVSLTACIETYRSDVGPYVRNVSTRGGQLVLDRCDIAYKSVVNHGPYGGKDATLTEQECEETEVEVHGR